MLMTREIAIGENNRVTIDLDVQPPGGAPREVTCVGEVSRDGKCWTSVSDLAVRATAPGTMRRSAPVCGKLLRFVVEHEGASDARCPIDLRVRLDRA